LVVTESNYRDLDTILSSYAGTTKLAVVTDAEGILGIGDQGFGGIAICMGKLTLYSLAAGIRPIETLPVLLDFGTNNKKLLEDPFYLGVRQPRTRGAKYFEMIDAFVSAFKKRFPEAMLQWEDFSKSTAFDVLARYRDSIPSFNDDIQGTGAMALGGLMAATEQGKTLTEQVFLVSGWDWRGIANHVWLDALGFNTRASQGAHLRARLARFDFERPRRFRTVQNDIRTRP